MADGEASEARRDGFVDPLSRAVSSALHQVQADPDPAAAAAARRLLEAQAELTLERLADARHNTPLERAHLRARRWGDRFKLAGQAGIAVAALVAAIGLGAMVWDAAHDRSVIVEPFRSPPEFAQRGYDGQALASRVLERLSEMQTAARVKAVSLRAAAAYSAEPTREVRLQIPETGVSIGELRRALSDWFGGQTHISGTLVRDGSTLSLSTRIGGEGRSYTGPDTDLPHLIEQAAEGVLEQTEPLTYADYLRSSAGRTDPTHGRADEAIAVYRRLSVQGSPRERAWAYVGWSETLSGAKRDFPGAAARLREAARLAPKLWLVWEDLADLQQFRFQDDEASLANRRRAAEATDFGGADPVRARFWQQIDRLQIAERLGDFASALAIAEREGERQTDPPLAFEAADLAAYEAVYAHDNRGSVTWTQRMIDRAGADDTASRDVRAKRLTYWRLANVGDWSGAADAIGETNRGAGPAGAGGGNKPVAASVGPGRFASNYFLALQAIALARAGRVPEARQVDALLPECAICDLAKAWTSEAMGDRRAADVLFANAVRLTPSLPRAPTAWGEARLARGEVNGAIDLFRQAHAKGPRFADPLELWGEALLRRADWRGAADKFAEADRYAPSWGRNHLRWAEALAKLGRTVEARAQQRAAAALDLSAADRRALASLS